VIATTRAPARPDCVLAAVKTNARYIGCLSPSKDVLIETMLGELVVVEERIAAWHRSGRGSLWAS